MYQVICNYGLLKGIWYFTKKINTTSCEIILLLSLVFALIVALASISMIFLYTQEVAAALQGPAGGSQTCPPGSSFDPQTKRCTDSGPSVPCRPGYTWSKLRHSCRR